MTGVHLHAGTVADGPARRAIGELHDHKLKILNFANGILLLIALLMISSVAGFGQRGSPETIDATAFGTSTQMGSNFSVKIIINEFSSPEDRDILVRAFQQGQNDGLSGCS